MRWLDASPRPASTPSCAKSTTPSTPAGSAREHLTGPQHLGYTGDSVPRELMVEAIRAYMADPNYLKTVAPKIAAAIREAVNSHPALGKIIQYNAAMMGLGQRRAAGAAGTVCTGADAMSITTYAELQDRGGGELARSPAVQQVASRNSSRCSRPAANRRLRVRQMETSTSLTPSSGSATLPSDYLAWRRVTWTGSTRVELEYVHPSYLQAAYPAHADRRAKNVHHRGLDAESPAGGTIPRWNSTTTRRLPRCRTPRGHQLAAHRASRPLPVRVAGRGRAVRVNENERAPLWKARRDEIFDEIEKLSNKTRGAGNIRVMGTVV